MKRCLSVLFVLVQLSLNAVVYLEKPAEFHPRIEVTGVFLEWDNRILLLHRFENKSQGNLWGIPGGKHEKGETSLEAAVRETQEETGFDLSKQELTYLGKVYIKYDNFDYIYHMVLSKPVEPPGSVKINFGEHKGFTWVSWQDALKMDLMADEDPCIRLIYEQGWRGDVG